MLKLKDLIKVRTKEKELIEFMYVIEDERKNDIMKASFSKLDPVRWQVNINLIDVNPGAGKTYEINYMMPRAGIALDIIAATGLRYFMETLQEELQVKSNVLFDVGKAIEGK